jgi:single-stranded-DNA-specific exonuclease
MRPDFSAAADPRPHVQETFRSVLERFDPGRPALILGHFDADGLSAMAILKRALDRAGQATDIRLVGKGENPWSPRSGGVGAARPAG